MTKIIFVGNNVENEFNTRNILRNDNIRNTNDFRITNPEMGKFDGRTMFTVLSIGLGSLGIGTVAYQFIRHSSLTESIANTQLESQETGDASGTGNIFSSFGSYLRECCSWLLDLLNPFNLLRRLITSLIHATVGRIKEIIFGNLHVVVILLIAAGVLYVVYKKIKSIRIVNQIYEDIKAELIEDSTVISQNQNDDDSESGIYESSIVKKYSEKYGFTCEYFRKNILPILRKRRRKDPSIKLAEIKVNGIKEVLWQLSDIE